MDVLHRFNAVWRRKALPQNRRLWLLTGAVFLIVAAIALWWDSRAGMHEGAPSVEQTGYPLERALSVPVVTVSPTITAQWLEATGTVQPELESAVAAKVIGRVQNVLIREGDAVRRGQPLVILDARDLDAAVTQANANLRAADVGYDTARVSARMETSLSAARITEAQAKVTQTEAALKSAMAKRDLVQAGPRRQEREQASLAVAQTRSSFSLAESNLRRMAALYNEGAISAQQYDQYRSQYEVASAEYKTSQQAQSLTEEGSRVEEIRAAQEAVRQAQAAVQEAYAGLKQAQASALQAEVRRQEIQSAQAQIGQSQAAVQIARVTRDYAVIASPFDGILTQRLVDPGAMASPGAPLLKVQGGLLRLEAVVPESALPVVRIGLRVPVRLDVLRHRELMGRIVEIAPQGDPSSHTFIVKIALPPRSGASSGMFGRARFITGAEKQLLIPTSAVWERDGLHYLYVVDESGIARLRLVTVGDQIGKQTTLLSGVNPDERIIAGGQERVTDGARVIAGRR